MTFGSLLLRKHIGKRALLNANAFAERIMVLINWSIYANLQLHINICLVSKLILSLICHNLSLWSYNQDSLIIKRTHQQLYSFTSPYSRLFQHFTDKTPVFNQICNIKINTAHQLMMLECFVCGILKLYQCGDRSVFWGTSIWYGKKILLKLYLKPSVKTQTEYHSCGFKCPFIFLKVSSSQISCKQEHLGIPSI